MGAPAATLTLDQANDLANTAPASTATAVPQGALTLDQANDIHEAAQNTDTSPAPPTEPNTVMGTLGYIGKRAYNTAMQLGDAGYRAQVEASPSEPSPDVLAEARSRNTTLPIGEAPNPVASVGGDIASAFAADPPGAVLAPAATAVGSALGTGASALNQAAGGWLPDWAVRGLASIVGGGGASYFLRNRGLFNPSAAPKPTIGNTDITVNPAMAKNLANAGQFEDTALGQLNTGANATRAAVGDASDMQTTGQGWLDKAKTWLKARGDEYGATRTDLETRASGPADFTASGNFATTYPRGPKAPGIVSEYAARVSDPNQPPPDVAELNRWYTRANELIQSNDSNAGSKQGLGAFKDTLRQDIQSTLTKKIGPDAADAMDNARTKYAGEQDLVRKAFGSLPDETTSPEDAFTQLTTNPAQNLSKLKALVRNNVLGESDVRAIADNTFREIGYNSDGVFDPTKFTQNLIALRNKSPDTVDFLFRRDAGAGGPQARAFDNLMAAAKDAHFASGNATAAQTNIVKNAAIEFAKRTGRAAALGTLGRMIPGAGEAGELALTLGGMGEGAPAVGAPLLQAARTRPYAITNPALTNFFTALSAGQSNRQ